MPFIPTVIQKSAHGERAYDIFSLLLQNRIIMLNGEVNDDSAALICAQLIYLESTDSKKDIHIYINSPGGSVTSCMSMIDVMNFVRPDIQTWGMGLAASCASLLLSAGTKGKRNALPHTRIMVHEPWGGYQGRSQHMEDYAKEIIFTRTKIVELYQIYSDQPKEIIEKWMDRETFLSAQEAKNLGLIDNVLFNRPSD